MVAILLLVDILLLVVILLVVDILLGVDTLLHMHNKICLIMDQIILKIIALMHLKTLALAIKLYVKTSYGKYKLFINYVRCMKLIDFIFFILSVKFTVF